MRSIMNKITINTLSELPSAAKQLLQICEGKKTFAFSGQMGAGKTTFIKTICLALGVKDTISSPTFSLVNEYHSATGEKIYHFDFYRIKDLSEAYDMGFEEYLYSKGYCFIEWPEKIEELLPQDCVKVNLTLEAEKRLVSIEV
ncbi:MAG: tRNA (adenosine(37)-N6)-threonylcarbamoyltransferase complex ATPase subunit type 1 TsaE [Bacteroidia bacterium]